jgi:hypothetical protein
MSGSWPKVIRDPVHNIIPFEDTPCDRLLLNLINTKEFQRLRRIKQLGASHLVFPGADHSRFAHSIGVMHTARKFVDRLARTSPSLINDDLRTVVLAAALLHDTGHGPFSHAFESITGESHETRTLEIISDNATSVCETLAAFSSTLPDRLRVFFDEDVEQPPAETGVPPFITKVISSQLDADRFDYLLRDSYATGASHGRFDSDWILEHLRVDASKGRLYLGQKALFAAESYVFARYHMYRTVYFHKTTRAAEVMLRLLFRRFKELLAGSGSAAARRRIVAAAPPVVVRAFSPESADAKMELGDYLKLDDHSITEFLKGCTAAKDEILRELGTGLLDRVLYKATDATDADKAAIGKFATAARERVTALRRDAEYVFCEDSPSDTPYKPYDPDDEKPAAQIYVEAYDGRPVELSTRSEPVDRLRKQYTLLRYYYPADIRDEIDKVARATLRREAS